jgi:hypothetical protein
MSAYLVDRIHIDLLVSLALERRADRRLCWYWQGNWHDAGVDGATYVGRMLWTENLRSLVYRYPEDTSGGRPGPCDLQDEEIAGYTHTAQRYTLTPVEGLQAILGYEYQACEHPGWEESEARAFCEALRHALIRRLPGYDAAPWCWTEREVAKRLGKGGAA